MSAWEHLQVVVNFIDFLFYGSVESACRKVFLVEESQSIPAELGE